MGDIAIRSFVSQRLPSKPLCRQHPYVTAQQQASLYIHMERPDMGKRHYPRLIRTWYRPVIEQLIHERRRQRMTQADVEKMIGCTAYLISKFETGIKLPSLYLLLLWCEALGVELQPLKVDHNESIEEVSTKT